MSDELDELANALGSPSPRSSPSSGSYRAPTSSLKRRQKRPAKKSIHFFIVPIGLVVFCILGIIATLVYGQSIEPSDIVRTVLTLILSGLLLTGQNWARILAIVLLVLGVIAGVFLFALLGKVMVEYTPLLMVIMMLLMVFYVYSIIALVFMPAVVKSFK